MAFAHIFEPRAADEYEQAFIWYEDQSFSAADNFVIAVQEAIKNVCEHPYRYRNTYETFREITVKKYPYNLIYLVDETNALIIIFSLFHHKRNPKKKY